MRSRAPRVLWSVLVLAPLLILGTSGHAQTLWRQGRGFLRETSRLPTKDSYDGSFNYCRGMYQAVRREDGGQGWSTDYPGADINLSVRLSELTKTRVKFNPSGEPDHIVVQLTDDALFRCPMLFMADTGTVDFTDAEVARLREYFLKGGLLWVDDFWGTRAWDRWVSQIGRVLPRSEYPIFDIPLDHPVLRGLFDVKRVQQVSSIQFWRRSGGLTSERGHDSPHADFRGINDAEGRLLVVMTHNTDISDTWEREGEDREYFYNFSPDGYALGIDIILYAMTH